LSHGRAPDVAGNAVTADAGARCAALWDDRENPTSVLLAVGALAGCGLAAREWIDRRDAALFEVLVGLWFLLFLVAAHLTLGHGDLLGARFEKIRRGARIANSRALVCSGEDCKTIDRKIFAPALLSDRIESGLERPVRIPKSPPREPAMEPDRRSTIS
jgi:hypothetical protein